MGCISLVWHEYPSSDGKIGRGLTPIFMPTTKVSCSLSCVTIMFLFVPKWRANFVKAPGFLSKVAFLTFFCFVKNIYAYICNVISMTKQRKTRKAITNYEKDIR